MKLIKFVSNLILAVILVALALLILLTVGGVALSRVWEDQGLDYGALENGLWLWVEGQPIHYLEWGAAESTGSGALPTIVLVHGLDVAGSATWLGIGRDLARRGYRVLAVDLRGFGHTAREGSPEQFTVEEQALLLAKVLNELHVQGATVVAHGWGSRVALRLADDQPQFVSQLVFIAPYDDLEVLRLWREACRWPYVGSAATWFALSGGPVWRYLQAQALANRDALPEGYAAIAARPTHIVGTVAALVQTAAHWDASEAATPGVPTTVLLGQEDRVVDHALVQAKAKRLGAEFSFIPKAGHYAQLDQPTAVNRLLAEIAGAQTAPPSP